MPNNAELNNYKVTREGFFRFVAANAGHECKVAGLIAAGAGSVVGTGVLVGGGMAGTAQTGYIEAQVDNDRSTIAIAKACGKVAGSGVLLVAVGYGLETLAKFRAQRK